MVLCTGGDSRGSHVTQRSAINLDLGSSAKFIDAQPRTGTISKGTVALKVTGRR
jgi:hypothetical protein